MTSYLCFSGSTRKGSYNQLVLNNLSSALRELGGDVTDVSLNDFSQPIYHGDEEDSSGLPEATVRFQQLLHNHDALVIACPEYNGFMTPLLLNALDWATRSSEANPDLSGFRDKPVLITSCSPGALAGMRAAAHLRTLLSGIGALVSPDSFAVPAGYSAFDEAGHFKDTKMQERSAVVARRFHNLTTRLVTTGASVVP